MIPAVLIVPEGADLSISSHLSIGRLTKLAVVVLCVGWLFPPTASIGQETDACPLRLVDVSETSGIEFVHETGGNGFAYIVEGVTAGLATLDYDGDGWIDIYLLNGAPLKGTPAGKASKNRLYRNNGDFTFTDVTDQAGVGDTGYGLGVTAGDYDGDGDLDLYVNNYGANVLYRNNGDKTFTNVTESAGVGNGELFGAGASFLDIEGDGDLDLYVGNYVNFTYENHVEILVKGKRYHAGPQYYKPVADTLYRNEGNGTFVDISEASGIASASGPSMGLICADFDADGDTDVYVCNDGTENFLFQNDGSGNFTEIGLLSGLGCDFQGGKNSSMGVDIGDYDNDGQIDLFTTNYQSEMPVLYQNLGGGLFRDVTTSARLSRSLYAHVNWGTSFADFDLDGDQDIFIACGHFDQVENIDDRTSYKVANYLLFNQQGRFQEAEASCIPGLQAVESSRGAAFDDLDNDGDVDIVVVNSGSTVQVLRNDLSKQAAWLSLELRQPGLNSHGIGTRIEVSIGEKSQVRECVAGRGYQSFFGSREYFGFASPIEPGSETTAKVQLTWPDNTVQNVDLALRQHHIVERSAQP